MIIRYTSLPHSVGLHAVLGKPSLTPNSEHEAFLVYIIEKNLTSKFYAIMLTHHTVDEIHLKGAFFTF